MIANKSSKKVVTVFLIRVCLSQILLFSFVRSDGSVCEGFCPPVGSVDGWETTCNLQQSSVICGDSDVRDIPSAPSNLKVKDIVHQIGNTSLLAMNITWVLPVTGNFTGLQGFYVSVVKTSYPPGSNMCIGIRFDHPLSVSSFTSEVVFQFACFRNIVVDSTYIVEITSIGSKKSIKLENYHTSKSPENWKPSQPPTTVVTENGVTVLFSTYPGDRWITYKINLRPCDGRPTPSALSQIVDTQDPVNQNVNMQDATGRYSQTFHNVPPGCYKAGVSFSDKQDGSPVDGFTWMSASFNVTKVSVRPNNEPTTSTDAIGNTENNKPVWWTPLNVGIIAGVVGVAVALVLIALVVQQRYRPRRQSKMVSSTEIPGDGIIDDRVQNNLRRPVSFYTSGYGGDSVSVF